MPSGSVAIAGRQSCVYPAKSPGGWHLLGRSPMRLVDVGREFFPLRAGDRVRFRAIDRGELQGLAGRDLGA